MRDSQIHFAEIEANSPTLSAASEKYAEKLIRTQLGVVTLLEWFHELHDHERIPMA